MAGFNINQITLSGNLTRDPELRTTPSGTSVCSMRIANNTRRKDSSTGEWHDKPNYFDVTVWGGVGEHLAGQLSKGSRIVVSGRIEWREWETQEGQKQQAYDVIAEGVVTPDGGGGGGERFTPQSDVPADTEGLPGGGPPPAPPTPDDDIPF